MKFMQLQQDEILKYYEEELQYYMRKQMPFDCLKNNPMYELLDFQYT